MTRTAKSRRRMGVTAFAAGDPITVVNNLSDFIFGLIRAVGLILLGTFAKEILNLIVG